MPDLDAPVVTMEQTRQELEALEQELAKELGIESRFRMNLLLMEMRGEIPNTDLAKRWQQTYDSWMDWLQQEQDAEDAKRKQNRPPWWT